MSKVTRYRIGDVVPLTSTAPDDDSLCAAPSNPAPRFSYLCTRERDHDGDHEAGSANDLRLASWPRD